MSCWQGRWLVGMWLLLPGTVWGQEPLLIPRAPRAARIEADEAPLKLARPATAASRTGGMNDTSRVKTTGWTTTTASLIFVLSLIAGGAYILRRQGRRFAGILPDEVVQILGRRHVDQRSSLQMIRCGSKILILANSTQHGLRTLSEITDPQEVETITGQCLSPSADSTSLLGRLRPDAPHPFSSRATAPGGTVTSMSRNPSNPTTAGGPRG